MSEFAAIDALLAQRSMLFAASNSRSSPNPSETNSSDCVSGDEPDRKKKTADYLERRRKNNDSARRSREVRRIREETNKQRMEALEEENKQLQNQMALLKMEYNQLVLLVIANQSMQISATITKNDLTPTDEETPSQTNK